MARFFLLTLGLLVARVLATNHGDFRSKGKHDNNNNNLNNVEIITIGKGNSAVAAEIIIIASNNGGQSQTQNWNQPQMTAGQVHQVDVGGTAGLVYSPESVTAAVGDMIQFNFMSTNHTVTQSTFGAPCVRMEGGVDSGFLPNPDNSISPAPMMMFQVMTTEPVWMYCRQKGHCGKGMVFSVNPTADKSQEVFKAAAVAQNGTAEGATQATTAAADSTAAVAESTAVAAESTVAASSSAAVVATAEASSSAVAASPSADSSSIVQGNGALGSGDACTCSCLCGVGSFPVNAGIGAIGGMGGSMPMSIAAAKKRTYRRITA